MLWLSNGFSQVLLRFLHDCVSKLVTGTVNMVRQEVGVVLGGILSRVLSAHTPQMKHGNRPTCRDDEYHGTLLPSQLFAFFGQLRVSYRDKGVARMLRSNTSDLLTVSKPIYNVVLVSSPENREAFPSSRHCRQFQNTSDVLKLREVAFVQQGQAALQPWSHTVTFGLVCAFPWDRPPPRRGWGAFLSPCCYHLEDTITLLL